jgi:regulator of nucleoside diphosphate kinase
MDSALLGLLVVLGMGLVLWIVLTLGTWLIRFDLRRTKPTASANRSRSRAVQVLQTLLGMVPHVDDNLKFRKPRISSEPLRSDDAPQGATSDEEEMPVITPADHQELMAAIIAARKLGVDYGWTGLLQEKLVRATIVARNDLPPDVITMHTRSVLVDLETNEQLELMLVYPVDANFAEGRISIFHPLGVATLGRRVGEQVEWQVPYGVRRFRVSAVQFQPEAVLALAA